MENISGKYRNLWETHYKTIHGIIFVIDSTDKMRLALARDELWMMLDHRDIAYKKVSNTFCLHLLFELDRFDSGAAANLGKQGRPEGRSQFRRRTSQPRFRHDQKPKLAHCFNLCFNRPRSSPCH